MIDVLTACTSAAGSAEAVVSDLLGQIDMAAGLKKNSIGIVNCGDDFNENGIMKALCERLPFDVIGFNTIACAANGITEQPAMALTILTSDTNKFAAGVSAPVGEAIKGPLEELVTGLRQADKRAPSLAFTFAPMNCEIGGDRLIRELDILLRRIPVFGSVGTEEEDGRYGSGVYWNGELLGDSVGLILVFGRTSPVFMSASVPEQKILDKKAVITKSQGNRLQELNGMPAARYLEAAGVGRESLEECAYATPLLLDYREGTQPVVRCIVSVEPDGSIMCGGDMPLNAVVSIVNSCPEDITQTTAALLDRIAQVKDKRGVLLYSCKGRDCVFGVVEPKLDLEQIKQGISGNVAYSVACSGGEFVPVLNKRGRYMNRFQNYSLVACIL